MTLEELIGNTPLVELQHIPVNKRVTIFGKLEGNNPGGSVKLVHSTRGSAHRLPAPFERGGLAGG
jgi:cysteine synthase B